jgi:CrcB protein
MTNNKQINFMTQIVFIAAGGAIGALLRFWMSQGIYTLLGRGFPYGTLSVNVLGSLVMGILYVFLYERMNMSPEWRAALVIGLLGAFTTFSTFSIETLNLLEASEHLKAFVNILLSISLCLVACWFGIIGARQL